MQILLKKHYMHICKYTKKGIIIGINTYFFKKIKEILDVAKPCAYFYRTDLCNTPFTFHITHSGCLMTQSSGSFLYICKKNFNLTKKKL